MPIFFFLIGLEIKRELVIGELSDPKKVVLAGCGRSGGGIVVPVGDLPVVQHRRGRARGWAVPMATDIAFVVGCLSLLGRRVPYGLTVLMLSLAIVDDLAAVLVIAVFYTSSIKTTWIAGALVGLVIVAAMNRLGVRNVWLVRPRRHVRLALHPQIGHSSDHRRRDPRLDDSRAAVARRTEVSRVPSSAPTTGSGSEEDYDVREAQVMVADLAFASREAVAPLDPHRAGAASVDGVHHHAAFRPRQRRACPSTPTASASPWESRSPQGSSFGKSIWHLRRVLADREARLGDAARRESPGRFLRAPRFSAALVSRWRCSSRRSGSRADLLVSAAKIGVLLGSFASAVVGMLDSHRRSRRSHESSR